MYDRAAETIQHAAQVVECASDVDVAHVNMPMLMRLGRLLETAPFARSLAFPFPQQSGLPQDPPHARRAYGHDVLVQHHERQPPISFQRIVQMEVDDRPLFPLLQPKVPGNPTVMLVGLAVTLPPIVKLAGGHVEPLDEPAGADFAGLRPAPDEIHDLVPRVVRHPDPV